MRAPTPTTCPYCLADLTREVTHRWDFYLPLEPPSQNYVGKNSGGWTERNRYKKFRTDFALLLQNKKNELKIPDAQEKRRVILTRLYAPSKHGRPRDRANIVGGAKMLVDAMVEVKLLVDDAEEWLDDYYRQLPCVESGVRIQLEVLR